MLTHVAFLHALLLLALMSALALLGAPVAGVMLGGVAIAAFYAAFWGAVSTLSRRGRRISVSFLVFMKIVGYPVLAFAALRSGEAFDGAGFAGGVSCFLAAALLAPLLGRLS